MMPGKSLIYQFDDVRVDLQSFKVFKAGAAVPLEPKALEVLVFLIDHCGRLIEKDELLDAVWKETFVTQNAMTRIIAQLRKALGDDAKDPRYIETVPTRGYRFIADVSVITGESPSREPKEQRFRERNYRITLNAIALLLIVTVTVWKLLNVSGGGWPDATILLKTRQLTSTIGMDIYPAFSPDGGSIAYCSLRKGKFEIFVKSLTPGGGEIQITTDGEHNLQPAWSPDGKMIAYHRADRGGIWLVPAIGGIARQLTEFGSDPAYSPDGQWIAFQSGNINDLNQLSFAAMSPSTLWKVSTRGGSPQPLTKMGDPIGGHGAPSWSPDGKRIVFVSYDIGRSGVWSIAGDGGDLRQISVGNLFFYEPVYSADGNAIYVTTGAGNFKLWKNRITPEGHPFGEPVEILNTGIALARHLTVAPDGKRIAYSGLMMSNNLASVAISAGAYDANSSPVFLTQDTNRRKTSHAFSPDGRTIAYNVWRMGADGETWLMDANGDNPRQLTTTLAGLLGWLPQGDRIAMISKENSANYLFTVDVKSGKKTVISEHKFETKLGKISPDATQVAYNSTIGGAINVWIASVPGGSARQLTFDQELMGFPNWSPDGKEVAFEIKRGNDTQVAIMPSNGGPPIQLTNNPGQNWPGGWSRDGDKISFAAFRNGAWNIWWVSRSTKAQKQLTHYAEPNIYVRYPAWSPLDNQIVYEFGETTGNIWMLELK